VATSSRSERVKRGSVTFDGLLQVAAILTVVFSVLTAIDTRQHYIELFSHFRLQYLVVSLLLLIACAVRRRNFCALILAVSVAVNASYVVPWYADGEAATGETRLRLLYANVLSTNRDHERVLELINSEQPDIIFLQEITPHWLEALQALQADYPFDYSVPREDNFGIAVWSRLPLSAASHIDSPPLGYPTILASTTIGGVEITFISTHPMIPLGGANFAARNQQFLAVSELAAQTRGEVILLGDLNASIWDRHYLNFEDATGLKNARRGYGILPTWPTFMPPAMIPIDHVLVSERVGIADIRTGPRIGSDHLPLVVTVTPP